MKVAFVSANREQLPDAVIPLGLLYLMEALPARHGRVLVDLCFEEEPLAFLRRRLAQEAPDLVALGMRNMQSNAYAGSGDHVAWYGSVLAAIRDATAAPVVVGGGGFSVIPAQLMARLGPDYGIAGEGELPLPMLIEALEGGGAGLEEVPNLYWMEGGGEGGEPLRHGPLRPAYVAAEAMPVPSRAAVDPRYYERYGIESVQTKRGCNLRCDYCTYPLVEGRVSRRRDPERVVDELLAIAADPRVRHVYVVDSVFNLPPEHAKDVCRAMIRRGPRLPWTCYANPLRFDEELAGLMAAAGCAGIEVGSDSGSDAVLMRLRKDFDTAAIRRLHAVAAAAGLKDLHSFILGTAGESLAQVERTLDFVDALEPFAAVFGIWVDDREAVDAALREDQARRRDAIHALLRERCATRPSWIVPALGIGFDPRLFAALRRAGCAGPLWQHLPAREPG